MLVSNNLDSDSFAISAFKKRDSLQIMTLEELSKEQSQALKKSRSALQSRALRWRNEFYDIPLAQWILIVFGAISIILMIMSFLYK
jgi:hypothetical protein